MHRKNVHCLISIVGLAGAQFATAVAGEIRYRNVALTGSRAPGTKIGVEFLAFTTPVNHSLMSTRIDDEGRAAFIAFLAGPGVDPTNSHGIWAEQDGELRLVVRTSDPAPGTAKGVRFLGLPNSEVPFAPAFVNGTAVIIGQVTGPGVDFRNDDGIWLGRPGAVDLLARENDPAPGLPAGVRFSQIGALINSVGHAVLPGTLLGDGINNDNREAIWVKREGPIELFFRKGDPAPLTEAGTFFADSFRTFPFVMFNDKSDLAIVAFVDGPQVNSSTDELLYRQRDGQLEVVVRENDQAPGLAPGVTFGNGFSMNLRLASLNDNGHVGFQVRLGGSIPTTSAIFSDRGGDLAPVAVEGDPAPGAKGEYTFFGDPMLNDADRIAFTGFLPDDDGDPFTAPPQAIFSDIDGPLTAVVLIGDETTAGDAIDDPFVAGFNRAGLMLIDVRMVDEPLRKGLVLRDTDGALHSLAATGELFDVSGNGQDLRRIIRVVTGGLSETGEAAFRLDFADGSSGHFVASLDSGSLLGDLNCDGDINAVDIEAFVFALFDPQRYEEKFPKCDINNGDVNRDGTVDALDIEPFLGLLFP